VSLFVDTSVWSLALRRAEPPDLPHVRRLRVALEGGEVICTTGVVLQELLQGFSGPTAVDQIVKRFAALPYVVPERRDHICAAQLRNTCRRAGLQVGSIDALLAQLCIERGLQMLSADRDFEGVASHSKLALWSDASD
jgi:predicted nucleic acid-binding protein